MAHFLLPLPTQININIYYNNTYLCLIFININRGKSFVFLSFVTRLLKLFLFLSLRGSHSKLLVGAHILIYVSVKYALSKFVLYLFYYTLGPLQIIPITVLCVLNTGPNSNGPSSTFSISNSCCFVLHHVNFIQRTIVVSKCGQLMVLSFDLSTKLVLVLSQQGDSQHSVTHTHFYERS